jgi:hypothetical protein
LGFITTGLKNQITTHIKIVYFLGGQLFHKNHQFFESFEITTTNGSSIQPDVEGFLK